MQDGDPAEPVVNNPRPEVTRIKRLMAQVPRRVRKPENQQL